MGRLKLKSTKKIVKKEIKNYEKEAQNTANLAEEFQNYFNDSILPFVNYANLKEHLEAYENAVNLLKNQIKTYENEIVNRNKKIKTLVEIKTSEFPDLCAQLTEKELELEQHFSELITILETAQFDSNRLNIINKEKERVYSCSMDWNIIASIQEKISTIQQELTVQENNINENSAQIEAIILQIGN